MLPNRCGLGTVLYLVVCQLSSRNARLELSLSLCVFTGWASKNALAEVTVRFCPFVNDVAAYAEMCLMDAVNAVTFRQ